VDLLHTQLLRKLVHLRQLIHQRKGKKGGQYLCRKCLRRPEGCKYVIVFDASFTV